MDSDGSSTLTELLLLGIRDIRSLAVDSERARIARGVYLGYTMVWC